MKQEYILTGCHSVTERDTQVIEGGFLSKEGAIARAKELYALENWHNVSVAQVSIVWDIKHDYLLWNEREALDKERN